MSEIKKVAIVGFAPSWKQAPFNDETFEIWGENSLFRKIPRYTRWFDMHPIETFNDVSKKGSKNYIAELNNLGCQIYLQVEHPDIIFSEAYPITEIMEEFNTNYFTNSISYMIALAIYEGFEEIHVYGVDMAQDTEYADQRPSCEYFLGIAEGKGIKTYIPMNSNLLKTKYLYGYDDLEQDAFTEKEKERIKMMRGRKLEVQQQMATLQKALSQYEGAIESSEHVLKQWGKLNYRETYKMKLQKK